MTIEELESLRDEILSTARKTLLDTGSLDAYFVLVSRDGSQEVIVALGGSMNDRGFKTALARKIRERVASGDIVAVIFVSDVFWSNDLTPEGQRIQSAFRLDVEQSAAAGLCTKQEGGMVQLESPILLEITRHEYRREGKKVEFVGTPETFRSGTHGKVLPSKMAGWFAEATPSEVRQ